MEWLEYLGIDERALPEMRSLAYLYVKQGKYETALKLFAMLNILSKGDIYDLQMLGALHLQLNQNLDALNFLDQAIKKDPHHLPTLLNRAKTLFALGYKKQGIAQAKILLLSGNKAFAQKADALLLSYL